MSEPAVMDVCRLGRNGAELYVALDVGPKPDGRTATRMMFCDGRGVLGAHGVNARIISVASSPLQFEVAAAALDGAVAISDGQAVRFEFIDTAGTGAGRYGYLKRIAYVEGGLYVVGDLCQIYQRMDAGWTLFEEALVRDLKAVGQGLNDIAGITRSDIVAVGERGAVLSYDGKHWSRADVPTNAALERVCIVPGPHYVICGAQGVLLTGSGDDWRLEEVDGAQGLHFRDVCVHRGEQFLCTATALYRRSADALSAVALPPSMKGALHRVLATDLGLVVATTRQVWLHAADGWSAVALHEA